ncbi:hypothetical protein DL766_007694 [Monosporascus sp. MC13-8B]|uniref:Restriction endonuclease type IV Mrr domain-containing protein n=1 Tax=Monosporascus cannonballus TaxID=155416 RepID=A0ABY0GTR1_9PEZI|nr:hypothetical protein DL763_011126 [Monosporascus cannonballus]RYO77102.1 hypothetical protein DL762_009485 [Monosporascus cannonballus]RYP22593.1 hypothetical protein DL766_007694 [Monosporascus sp. MC13-8B]
MQRQNRTAAVFPQPSSTLRYPDPPSTEHDDLASYAAYAARTGLDTASTVYTGTEYEYTVAASLRRLGFDMRRVGGRSDCGIDLLGTWAVPPSSASSSPLLRVLLQCKASSGARGGVAPRHIRELEGAFVGAPAGWRGAGVLGLLVAQKPATKGIRDALGRSRWPMGYVSCSRDGRLEQMIWNRRAGEEGLEGVGVGVRYRDTEGGPPEGQLILTWRGRPYVPDEQHAGDPVEPLGDTVAAAG